MATVRIQLRRGTAAQWTSANPTLVAGEMGVETDTRKVKVGDGTTAWTSLDYVAADSPEISEIAQDAINDALVAGTGITKSYDDNANTITVSVDTSVIATKAELAEVAQDSINDALTAGTGITKSYDDAANTLTVSVDTDVISTLQYVDDEIANLSSNLNNTITSDYIPFSEKGAALGVATLDADTLVPLSELTHATDYTDTHNSTTTDVHGISDTSILVTTTGSQTLLSKSLTSPSLTGTPTAPTAANGTDTTQIATTEFVQNAIEIVVGSAPDALNTLSEIAASLNNDADLAGTLTSAISEKVAKSGDTMTGSLDMGSNKMTNLGTPTLNTDASNKIYVDTTVLDKITLHNEDTTSVHGIPDTSTIVFTGDPRLSDQRIPSDDSVSTVKMQDGAVTTAKIYDSSITTEKVVSSAITNLKIADNAVTNEKISSNAVTEIKIEDNAVTTTKIANSAVTTAKITDSNITTVKIANDAVTTAKIADSNITTAKIADDAVTTAKIADDAVTTAKITDSNITTVKIANDAVTTEKIADNAVTTAKITDSNITTAKIANDAVTTAKIADSNITTAKIADDAVTTAKIADDAVTTIKILDANITTEKINNSAITENKLATDAVTTGKIADGAVTSGKIADGTIVNADINSSAAIAQSKIENLTADLAAKALDADLDSHTGASTSVHGISDTANLVYTNDLRLSDTRTPTDDTVSTAKIQDSAVTTAKINDGAVTSGKIADGTIVNSDINASAAIDWTKLAVSSTVSSTELGYLDGVTSAIQTQLDAKALDADLDSHTGASTSVHGISDTAQLAYLNAADQTFTGNMEVDGNMTVDGNLTVNGTTFNASATSIVIEDNMVQLAHENAANSVDLGLVVAYNDGTAKHSGIVRDVSEDKWKLFKGVTSEPSTTVDFTQGSLDDLEVAGLTASSLTVGSVSNTEIGYLDGVTSAIQTQLDAKAPSSGPTFTGTVVLPSTTSVGNVSSTELGYLDGVTSAIQTQLDAKAPTANPTFTGTVTVAASGVAYTDGTQTKAGVPSLTTIASATTGAYNLSTGGLALRDQLIPIGGTHQITVPTNATTAYPTGTSISFYQSAGTGGSFVGASGVTILATPGATLRTTYSSATITKVGTDTWLLVGDLRA